MMPNTPKHWNHKRRAARAPTEDTVELLLRRSVREAQAGHVLNAARTARYAEHLMRMRLKLRQPRFPAPMPPPPPPAPPVAASTRAAPALCVDALATMTEAELDARIARGWKPDA